MGQIKVFVQELGLKPVFLANTNMDYFTSEWPGTPECPQNYGWKPSKWAIMGMGTNLKLLKWTVPQGGRLSVGDPIACWGNDQMKGSTFDSSSHGRHTFRFQRHHKVLWRHCGGLHEDGRGGRNGVRHDGQSRRLPVPKFMCFLFTAGWKCNYKTYGEWFTSTLIIQPS